MIPDIDAVPRVAPASPSLAVLFLSPLFHRAPSGRASRDMDTAPLCTMFCSCVGPPPDMRPAASSKLSRLLLPSYMPVDAHQLRISADHPVLLFTMGKKVTQIKDLWAEAS